MRQSGVCRADGKRIRRTVVQLFSAFSVSFSVSFSEGRQGTVNPGSPAQETPRDRSEEQT